MNLYSTPEEKIAAEIEQHRAQAAALNPPRSRLQAIGYFHHVLRALALGDELSRRRAEQFSKDRRNRRAAYSWRTSSRPSRSIAAKLERESKKRLKFLLELPEPVMGLSQRLGVA